MKLLKYTGLVCIIYSLWILLAILLNDSDWGPHGFRGIDITISILGFIFLFLWLIFRKRKISYFLQAFILMIPFSALFFVNRQLNLPEMRNILLPQGYTGLIQIYYEQPEGKSITKDKNDYHYFIPDNGILHLTHKWRRWDAFSGNVISSCTNFYYPDINGEKQLLSDGKSDLNPDISVLSLESGECYEIYWIDSTSNFHEKSKDITEDFIRAELIPVTCAFHVQAYKNNKKRNLGDQDDFIRSDSIIQDYIKNQSAIRQQMYLRLSSIP